MKQEVIWKYMDLGSLIWMLENRAVYFSHPTQFVDPFESAFHPDALKTANGLPGARGTGALDQKTIRKLSVKLGASPEAVRRRLTCALRMACFVSCWYAGESESEAMWKLYSKNNQGVAVKSTIEAVETAFSEIPNISRVEYTDDLPAHPIHALFTKRRAFQHEREVRLVVFDQGELDHRIRHLRDDRWEPSKAGVVREVKLKKLIQEIRLHPQSVDWMEDLLGKVLKRYSLRVPFNKSPLYEDQPSIDELLKKFPLGPVNDTADLRF